MLMRLIPPSMFLLLGAVVLLANQNTARDEADDAVPPASLPGITVHFKADGAADTRIDRLIALHVPADQPATPLLSAGPFTATYTGFINVGLRGRFTFSLEGRGRVKVTLADNIILQGQGDLAAIEPAERIRLNKGENAIRVEYASPDDGDAVLRLYWHSDEFPREQVHPSALTSAPLDHDNGLIARHGRDLFANHHCIKCHEPAKELKEYRQRMAELSADAPRLSDVASRLRAPWMAHWIQNPRQFRADATMPRLTAPPQRTANDHLIPGQQAWDIAAYLDTLGQKPPLIKRSPDTKETLAAGGNLFASLGCIGCHTLPTHNDEKTIDDRVPLKWVTQKFHREALPAFLMNPQAHYAWIRMPDFKLSQEEAQQITAFLWSMPGERIASIKPGNPPDATRGKQLVQSLGCLNCHEVKADGAALANQAKAPSLAAIFKGDWKLGCTGDDVAAKPQGGAPRFDFPPDQRMELRLFARRGDVALRSLLHDTPDDFARRQIAQLQCAACHKRDGGNDRWSDHESEVASLLIKSVVPEKPKVDDFDEEVPGDEQKEVQIDQSRPELTWVGEKLKPQWMEQFFAGKLDYKLRPWLTARMPAFPMQARGLSQGLALQHGLPPVAAEEPGHDAELATLGKQLVGRSIDGKAGFACVQCHAVGDKVAENVFEAQGINFAYSKERLNGDFYMRWMLKPARVQPGTRMPQFAADDGTTPFTDVLDGDGRRQFEAIWQYLLQGRSLKAP